MSSTPQFTSAPRTGAGVTAGANTGRDGSGANQVDLVTAPANGSRIDELIVTAQGTTTAGMIRVWVNKGGTYFLRREIPVTVVVPSATVAAWTSGVISFTNLRLASGEKLAITTHNNEVFTAVAHAADYT